MNMLPLDGNWMAHQIGGRLTVPAAVPGDIHAALLRAGQIPDPFDRDNELKVQWVGETDWKFCRTFHVAADLLRHDRVILQCDGLDTLASVFLNGKLIGRADNMFRTWEFDVAGILRPGINRIEVRFASAAQFIKAQAAARPKDQPLPQWKQPGALPGANFIHLRGRSITDTYAHT
jgi:beta-mannosidase